MTRPRKALGTLTCTMVLVMVRTDIMPKDPITKNTKAREYEWVCENKTKPTPKRKPFLAKTWAKLVPLGKEAKNTAPAKAPKPMMPSITPHVEAEPLKTSFAKTGVKVVKGKTKKLIIAVNTITELTSGVFLMY